ncbi:hypothetical protein [Rhizobium leguminosarum]|uniref:hypothetical protein n=1 Tax=Rhizobium leguminosarum TaxID=384 RepID=UPI001C94E892|nr:hypothetical protein [Rhizobium leguminosarum]MBY5821491.1 hypothetical protein [Rhizobium leguminosarum]
MSSIFDWSLIEANNANADTSINWQEGQLPSTVNNSARNMMTRVAQLLKDIGGTVTAGGAANALTVTANSPLASYATGQIVGFKASATNTGAATLNVNGVGSKAIRKNTQTVDAALSGGEIIDGGLYTCVYAATLNAGAGGWLLLHPSLADVYSRIAAVENVAPKGYLYGLALANNTIDSTNDIDITAGEAASDDATSQLMSLPSGLTKRLDANWVAGTNQGMLDTGSIANGTQHIFEIKNPTTAVVDILASLSATAPTMPSGFTLKRRIGSILRESGSIVQFEQSGDKFLRTPTITRNNTSAAASFLLDLQVPGGIRVRPILRSQLVTAAAGNWTNAMGSPAFGSANDAYQNVGSTATSSDVVHIDGTYTTNTSSQLYFSATANSGTCTINLLATIGWYDDRGRSL